MELEWNTILNVMVAMFIYNLILKSIANTILNRMFGDKGKKAVEKTFREQLNKALEEQKTKTP